MRRRTYQGAADVTLLQAFNAAPTAATGGCDSVHPRDIPHRLFNGNRSFDPAEVMTLSEDRAGVAARLLVGPRHRAYDARVRPDLRGEDFERAVLEASVTRSSRRTGRSPRSS
jgi:hypothetical protein